VRAERQQVVHIGQHRQEILLAVEVEGVGHAHPVLDGDVGRGDALGGAQPAPAGRVDGRAAQAVEDEFAQDVAVDLAFAVAGDFGQLVRLRGVRDAAPEIGFQRLEKIEPAEMGEEQRAPGAAAAERRNAFEWSRDRTPDRAVRRRSPRCRNRRAAANFRIWQRERMVGSSPPVPWAIRIKSERAGGSSSSFSSALAALRLRSLTGSMMTTR
jgi:hypothetical protein